MNNLHRPEMVEAFRARGVEVCFLVRADYLHLMNRVPGCRYLACRFAKDNPRSQRWLSLFRYTRTLYPANNPGKRAWFKGINAGRRLSSRVAYAFLNFLARFRLVMQWIAVMETWFYRPDVVEGLDPAQIDQLLLLGVGTHGAEHESVLTWWARRHGIPVVHMVANYDHLASQGYRSAEVDNLLVWGPTMRHDAIHLHGIAEKNIRMIGALRYNNIARQIKHDRDTFLKTRGLDPTKRIILFAGGMHEYHYFEMLRLFDELQGGTDAYQLILRVYPDKMFMASPYIKPLIGYAANLPGVYVSVGDPFYQTAAKDRPVMQFEEDELWHALQYSDVVINLYSTIALEACLFDKPVVYQIYYPMQGYAWLQPPRYLDWGLLSHNRRLVEYGFAQLAHSSQELLAAVEDAVAHPERFRTQRRRAVAQELGVIDGAACERLVEACLAVWERSVRGGATTVAAAAAQSTRAA